MTGDSCYARACRDHLSKALAQYPVDRFVEAGSAIELDEDGGRNSYGTVVVMSAP